MQTALRHCHQQGVHGGEGEQTVSQHGDEQMGKEHRLVGIRQQVRLRTELLQQYEECGWRQHESLQAVETVPEIRDPIDQHREPEDGRQGIAETEIEAAVEQAAVEHVAMEC